MKKLFVVTAAIILSLSLLGCSATSQTNTAKNTTAPTETQSSSSYKKITAEEAKKIMDSGTDHVVLDVRTKQEYDEGHIKDAILIPDTEITQKAESMLPDKNKQILVYCRSGRRSAGAAKELIKLGYTNVLDFGGIIDWKYETVK